MEDTELNTEPGQETKENPEQETKTGSEPESETETGSEPESRTEPGIQPGSVDSPASGTDMQEIVPGQDYETLIGYIDSLNRTMVTEIGLSLGILLCVGILCGCVVAHALWTWYR